MGFEEDIRFSIEVLRKGGVLLYPTDTIWGLGCDATNPSAVNKIFKVKSRTGTNSLIILVNGESMLERYVKEVPESASQIIEVSDKPITIIYPEGKNLAAGVCSDDGSVGIRICEELFCNELITRFRKPIVSTSANISGKPAPSFFSEIDEEIVRAVDYAVKYRQEEREIHSASPVIKIERNGALKILRM